MLIPASTSARLSAGRDEGGSVWWGISSCRVIDGLPGWWSRGRRGSRLVPWREGVDDQHKAAAAGAGRALVRGLFDQRFFWCRCHPQHVAGLGKAVLASGAGEPPRNKAWAGSVSDTVKAAWKNVDQEAANELVGGQRHDQPTVSAGARVILLKEGDLIAVEPDEAAVGDGNPWVWRAR